jgi:hypothetical protein
MTIKTVLERRGPDFINALFNISIRRKYFVLRKNIYPTFINLAFQLFTDIQYMRGHSLISICSFVLTK